MFQPGWEKGANEIGHNLAGERPKFGHNLVRERQKIWRSLERERYKIWAQFCGRSMKTWAQICKFFSSQNEKKKNMYIICEFFFSFPIREGRNGVRVGRKTVRAGRSTLRNMPSWSTGLHEAIQPVDTCAVFLLFFHRIVCYVMNNR